MSAGINNEQIVKTEEFCLTALSKNIMASLELGVRASEQATSVMSMASMVHAALEGGDMSKGLLVSTSHAADALSHKHLVREYIATKDDIIIRQYLVDCPATTAKPYTLSVPKKGETYH